MRTTLVEDFEWLRHKLQAKPIHKTHNYAHLIYFATAALEAHGLYSIAAGALFLLGLAGLIAGQELN